MQLLSRRSLRLYASGAAMLSLALQTGCHSPYVAATVTNRMATPLALVEVDYPSASFGTQTLAPGEVFHYRFKVLGSGNVKVIYTDAARKEHTVAGPKLQEGDEGPLQIAIGEGGVTWQPQPFTSQRR